MIRSDERMHKVKLQCFPGVHFTTPEIQLQSNPFAGGKAAKESS
jgi:hypothetical protein